MSINSLVQNYNCIANFETMRAWCEQNKGCVSGQSELLDGKSIFEQFNKK